MRSTDLAGTEIVANVAEASMGSVGYLVVGDGGTGSCWALDERLLVTSGHVVESIGYETCQVRIGGRLIDAKVTGIDQRTDLAVLTVKEKLTALQLQERARVGELCISIGSPLGFVNSVSLGIVSAIGRSLEDEDQSVLEDLVQTDAAINPGNSGGPLLNLRGAVIGVSTKSHRSAEGMHYAVSSRTVKFVTDKLRKDRAVSYARMGVLLAEEMDKLGTVRVKVVRANRESNPFRLRDEITEIEGRAIQRRVDVLFAMAESCDTKTIRVLVVRDGVSRTLKVPNLRGDD
jgi:S1-C subfamily serine protease